MMGTDTSNDARPNPYKTIGNPLHTICLVSLGLVVHRQRQPGRVGRRLR